MANEPSIYLAPAFSSFISYHSPQSPFLSHPALISVPRPQQACCSASGFALTILSVRKILSFHGPVPISAQASPPRNTFIDQLLSPLGLFYVLLSLSEFICYLFLCLSSYSRMVPWEPKPCLTSSAFCPKPPTHRNCLVHICWMNDWIKGCLSYVGMYWIRLSQSKNSEKVREWHKQRNKSMN